MNLKDIKLPSNKKFGSFFCCIFLAIAAYFYLVQQLIVSTIFIVLLLLLFFITITAPQMLSPFNKLWMRIGFILGLIISPIVIGIIFFLVITPTSLITRFCGRDELKIKLINKKSYWKVKNNNNYNSDFFKNQF